MVNSSALLKKDLVQPKDLPKLSPSSINLYIQEPALWVLKHFYGSTGEFNIHAMRGVAVEEGLNLYLRARTSVGHDEALRNAIVHAQNDFSDKAFFYNEEDLQKIECEIGPWVEKCVEAMGSDLCGEPEQQNEVETEILGFPIRGFMDYKYKTTQVDLKTTSTVPKAVTRGPRKGFLPTTKAANVRQQVIYHKATGLDTFLLYVSPEDYYYHQLTEEEMAPAEAEIEEALIGMKKLLTSPIKDVIKNTQPDWKKMKWSFYWDGPLRKLAEDVWEDYIDGY